MRIAITIAITLTLAATLAPLQQARGWAATCADGNTDVCCHLEQRGWDVYTATDLSFIRVEIAWQLIGGKACSPLVQQIFDRTIPRMCETDCWGGAIAVNGDPSTMPTQAEVLTTQCTVTHFVNGTCPPPAATTPTPTPISSTAAPLSSSSSSSSSTASATESSSSSSSSSTGANANAHSASSAALGPADEDAIGAAVPQVHSHWAFALAFALVLWH